MRSASVSAVRLQGALWSRADAPNRRITFGHVGSSSAQSRSFFAGPDGPSRSPSWRPATSGNFATSVRVDAPFVPHVHVAQARRDHPQAEALLRVVFHSPDLTGVVRLGADEQSRMERLAFWRCPRR